MQFNAVFSCFVKMALFAALVSHGSPPGGVGLGYFGQFTHGRMKRAVGLSTGGGGSIEPPKPWGGGGLGKGLN